MRKRSLLIVFVFLIQLCMVWESDASNGEKNRGELQRASSACVDIPNQGTGNKIPSYLKVVNGKVGGKVPIDDFHAIRKASVKDPNSKSITLGKFKAEGKSYITEAKKSNSSYFDLGEDFGKIQNKYNLTDKEMFDFFNKPFLDDAIASGKTIKFSHNPELAIYKGSFLEQEWSYLKSKGYKSLMPNGGEWIAK